VIAALYIDPKRGPYASMEGIDPWGVERDAKLYDGPGPVVAHPPCGPWGRLRWKCYLQDPDCGPRAVEQVLEHGGILEHPAESLLWKHCGLPRPIPWPEPDAELPRVWTLEIDQCDWGHAARKRTWLLMVGVPASALGPRPEAGIPTRTIATGRAGRKGKLCLPKSQRHLTPPAFAAWLVSLARSAFTR